MFESGCPRTHQVEGRITQSLEDGDVVFIEWDCPFPEIMVTEIPEEKKEPAGGGHSHGMEGMY